MIFVIILVLLIVLALGIFLYKILKEETVVIEEEIKKEKEEKRKNRKFTYIEKIENSSIEQVLEEVKNNPNEIDKLRIEVQSELRKATRANDAERVRKINNVLKKIDKIL